MRGADDLTRSKADAVLRGDSDRLRAMRRSVLVLLMLVLSLQSFWAAASSTCMHGSTFDTAHFGHHEHRHAASADVAGTDAEPATGAVHNGFDADCPSCIGHGTPAAMDVAAWRIPQLVTSRVDTRYVADVPSRIPPTPLRPPSILLA